MSKSAKLVVILGLILLISVSFQFKQKAAFSWVLDLVLAVLILAPLFLEFTHLLFFESFSIFILHLTFPLASAEIIFLSTLPFSVFIFRKIFPWQSWLEPFLAAIVGVLGFYAFSSYFQFSNNFGLLIADAFVVSIFAWIIYSLLLYVSKNAEYNISR